MGGDGVPLVLGFQQKGEGGKTRIGMGVGVKRGGWVLWDGGESRGVGRG